MEAKHGPAPTDEALVSAAHAGDTRALDQLIERHLPWICRQASRYPVSGLEAEDLVQEGLLGLVAAVKRDLPGIKTPTLIVHAGNDDIASARSNALYVRDHIGGPTELLLLDRSYHMVTIDQERNVVGDATARFAWNLLSDAERERLAAVAREPVPAAPETSAQTPDAAAAPSPASSAAEGMEKAAEGAGR